MPTNKKKEERRKKKCAVVVESSICLSCARSFTNHVVPLVTAHEIGRMPDLLSREKLQTPKNNYQL